MFPSINFNGNSYTIILAYTFIGLGLLFIHFYHICVVFENETNFSKLTTIEKEMIFKSDHALYYSYFKTIAEAPTFADGIKKLTENNLTEFPNTINTIQKFYIFPELAIGFLYKQYMYLANMLGIRTVTCWNLIRENDVKNEIVFTCDGYGEPIYFYIISAWYMGGLTIFLLYMYATYLSRNKLGGLSAVIYYFTIHNDATQLHRNPAARENFAFPFILWQMFYLTVCIERHTIHLQILKKHGIINQHAIKMSTLSIIKFTFLATLANLSWEYSMFIFSTQTIIIIILLQLKWIQITFFLEYTVSHLIANIISCYVMHDNLQYLLSIQQPLLIMGIVLNRNNGLFTFNSNNNNAKGTTDSGDNNTINNNDNNDNETINENLPESDEPQQQQQIPKSERQRQQSFITKFQIIIREFFLLTIIMFIAMEVFHHNETVNGDLNVYYLNLIVSKLNLLIIPLKFHQLLNLCNPELIYINFDTLKMYNNIFVGKFFSVFVIIFLINWLQKRREIPENLNEKIERSKNYLLEDYLEENKISMKDLTNVENDKDILQLLKLLKKCNYDYDKYKIEKSKRLPIVVNEKKTERLAFLNDVKKFKEKIYKMENKNNKLSKTDNNKKNIQKDINKTTNSTEKYIVSDSDDDNLRNIANFNDNKKKVIDDNIDTNENTSNSNINNNNNNNNINGNDSNKDNDTNKKDNEQAEQQQQEVKRYKYIQPYYFYNIVQTLVFIVMASLVLKLKYILSPFMCLMASSFPPKNWFSTSQQQRYWTIYLILIIFSIADSGIQNIKNQYKPKPMKDPLFTDMINWINLNTDKYAVFAGPSDIISTVMLTTRRPIVNHSRNEHRNMRKRTERVYSIFSKQHSSEIYNKLAKLKVQYVILSYKDCFLSLSESENCKLANIWDQIEPENKNNKQFCAELFQKSNPDSFLKVFTNEKYIILKIFSQSVQLELKSNSLAELIM